MAIYFIQNEASRAVKIGHSANVKARLAALRTSSPDRLRLLGTIPGDRREEREMHESLARHRMNGEWFAPSAEVIQAVNDRLKAFGMNGMHVGYWMANWKELVPRLNAVVSKAMGFECELAWMDSGIFEALAGVGELTSQIKWRCEPIGDTPFARAWSRSEHCLRLFDTPVEAAHFFIQLHLGEVSS